MMYLLRVIGSSPTRQNVAKSPFRAPHNKLLRSYLQEQVQGVGALSSQHFISAHSSHAVMVRCRLHYVLKPFCYSILCSASAAQDGVNLSSQRQSRCVRRRSGTSSPRPTSRSRMARSVWAKPFPRRKRKCGLENDCRSCGRSCNLEDG
jgi:hypothetical protein